MPEAMYLSGDVAETRFQHDCAIRRLSIASSRANQVGWDFIVVTRHRCVKVQVKFTSPITPRGCLSRSYSAKLASTNYDVLAMWLPDRQKWCFLTRDQVGRNRKTFRVYVDAPSRHAGRPISFRVQARQLSNWDIFD